MDRGREARRGVTMAASNGLSRRRHRSNSLRDSPEEDGTVELQETARLRDRKKDRDRDRERDRERDRDRLNRNSKRRRSDKFMHGSNREDGGDDSSEESVNDDEEDDEDDGVGIGGGNSSVRMLPPNPPPSSSSVLNHHHHHHHHHNSNSNNINSHHSRKSYPPPAKVFRASPAVSTTTSTWKAADEMIGVSVPRKARSASTKRSHECWSSGGVVVAGSGEQIHRQTSTSPVRQSTAAVLATPAPASPSSSNASARKKMKPGGPKPRPPKSSGNNKPSSSVQDEIEIEIAEVLYGMMRQPQCSSKQDTTDSISRDNNNNNINKSSNDAKSRVSSPISNSPSTAPLSSSVIPSNSSSSTAPITASAPKRKRPRPVKYEEENLSTLPVRNSPISSATKMETDQPAKPETSSPPHLEKNSGSVAAENGSFSYDLMSSQASEQPQLEVEKPESKPLLADSKGLTEVSESGGDMTLAKDEPQSPNKEPSTGAGVRLEDERRENSTLTKNNPTVSGIENQREEKFQIDLMAPPFRSSPERDGETDFASMDLQPEMKPQMKEDVKAVAIVKDKDDANTETEEKNAKTIIEESESRKPVSSRDRKPDLQLDLEKNGRDSTTGPSNKLQQHAQKQQQPQPPVVPEKTALSNSLPLPLSMASWPGGLPPMGYMAPLQGVVSMDGSNVSSATIQPPHLLFTQPRPKRCATHCYIARNIHYHQQFTRMNPFWPAAAGSASLYGAKACNLNVVPPADLSANIPGKGVNTIHDKGQGLAIFAGNNNGKDNKGSQPANIMDASQRKQILLQQAIPPGAPNNLLQAPAFIFPLSQQAAAAAASVRPGSAKPPAAAGSAVSSSVSNAVSASTTGGAGSGAAAAAAMGFNYPNMPGSETQYLAILQNNAYPFPISAAHVGAPPAYRGTHAQPMPFFNGSFYSSQMLHPSQLHQQQQQQQLPAQSQQIQHGGHQNTSISSGSSSSQKHLQNQQQQRQQSINGGSGTMQGFPAPKNQPQQQLQQHHQQRQQQQSETGGEESPSTADSRVSRMNMSIYSQNFAMPGHPPPTFALMSNATMGGATTVSGNHIDKKPQQQQQLPHTFPMSFASINGATTAPGFDLSSIAQNPAILQNLPEAMRHGYQIMAAAQAAQQKKNYRVSEEGNKTRGNDASPILEEENKSSMAGKPPPSTGHSIAFSRPDLTDGQVSSVVDTSTRPLNLGSASARSSLSNVNVSATQQQQMQRNQQQQQQQQHQMIQLQKQQQFAAAAAAAAARNKTPATSNGNVFSDHIPSSSSMAAKFPTALSGFPQNLVQNSSSSGPGQSPQWKNSARINTSQVTSYPLAASTSSSLKNLSQQQQGRTQQSHTVISFATNPNPKTSISAAQGQQGTPSNNNNNSSSSPPVMVGSPTSSVSKISAGGSPRTTATASSGGNKGSQGQASSLSSQQAKNSPSVPSRKSSPVPSILGNPNTGSKLQMTQQHQQQLQKQALQQAQLLFTNASAYMQAQAQAQQAGSNTSSAMAAGGLFMHRHRDQQLQQQVTSSSTGVLSLCPPVTTHSNTATSDPAKAVAAANNMKGGGGIVHPVQFSTSQSSGKSHQVVPAGFSSVHAVPSAVQVKATEQKQPAGE